MEGYRLIPILFEDNHLLVVNKPCGMATMGDDVRTTVHQTLCDYLRVTYAKPGKVYLGVVHRLDALASGVLVMARTSKSASRLSEQFRRESQVLATDTAQPPSKNYLVVVESSLQTSDTDQLLTDRIRKNESQHRMEVVSAADAKGDTAKLSYRVLQRITSRSGRICSLLQVQLFTGRKHQIRVQLANRGMPVFGDRKYGASEMTAEAIALHAWKLSILHPTLKQPMTFSAPLPSQWTTWFPGFQYKKIHSSEPD